MLAYLYWNDDAEDLKTWPFRTEKHPLQHDGNDCGPFALNVG